MNRDRTIIQSLYDSVYDVSSGEGISSPKAVLSRILSRSTRSHTAANSRSSSEEDSFENSYELTLACCLAGSGVACVWLTPVLMKSNHFGPFIVAWLILSLIFSIPLMLIQLHVGTTVRESVIECFSQLTPIFRGIGWAYWLQTAFLIVYRMIVPVWFTLYAASAFSASDGTGFATCRNRWNTANCTELCQTIDEPCLSSFSSPGTNNDGIQEFVKFEIENRGSRSVPSTIYAFVAIWILMLLVLLRGTRFLGKISVLLVILPFFLLCTLLALMMTSKDFDRTDWFSQLTADNNWIGLLQRKTWIDALFCVFFGFGFGTGIFFTIGSQIPNRTKAIFRGKYSYALYFAPLLSVLHHLFLSILVSLIIYGALDGNLSDDQETAGNHLTLIAFPRAIIQKSPTNSTLWISLFFSAMFFISIGPLTIMVWALGIAVRDIFPYKMARIKIVGPIVTGLALPGSIMLTSYGVRLLHLFDLFLIQPFVLITLGGILALCYAYGRDNLSKHLWWTQNDSPSNRPNLALSRVTSVAMFTAPFCLMTFGIWSSGTAIVHQHFPYNKWMVFICYTIAAIPLLTTPSFFAYYVLKRKMSVAVILFELLTASMGAGRLIWQFGSLSMSGDEGHLRFTLTVTAALLLLCAFHFGVLISLTVSAMRHSAKLCTPYLIWSPLSTGLIIGIFTANPVDLLAERTNATNGFHLGLAVGLTTFVAVRLLAFFLIIAATTEFKNVERNRQLQDALSVSKDFNFKSTSTSAKSSYERKGQRQGTRKEEDDRQVTLRLDPSDLPHLLQLFKSVNSSTNNSTATNVTSAAASQPF